MKHPLKTSSLPYSYSALGPFLSEQALKEHHLRHEASYIRNLKSLLQGYELGLDIGLEDLIGKFRFSDPGKEIFNNAAQIWNHEFYWSSMTPHLSRQTAAKELSVVFDMAELKSRFLTAGQEHFGSGWLWIARTKDGNIVATTTHDAETLAATDSHPLLVCDLWEHSYYLDFQSNRAKYLERFWHQIDWQSFYDRLKKAHFQAQTQNSA